MIERKRCQQLKWLKIIDKKWTGEDFMRIDLLRQIPPIHILQKNNQFFTMLLEFNIDEQTLTQVIQTEVNQLREQLLSNEYIIQFHGQASMIDHIFSKVKAKLQSMSEYHLQKVVNATGVILHTNLGRARLSDSAVKRVAEIASNYSNLEFDLDSGTRGSRHDIIENIISKVTGAEAAMVVNNNAAAVFLVLRALAKDREVIVSRGQLVEIGGSFRISAIMEESGVSLKEVGTTNKTHLHDYEEVINEQTAMIMKVHTSNFKTIGFTKTVPTQNLVQLKEKYDDILFYEDLGSGSLFDFQQNGIGDEPVVRDILEQGVDLVSFSGDKLLGGPQAGIIVGKKPLIDLLKKHQLARVLRVDKMTFAALEDTLLSYLKGNILEIPTLRDLLETTEAIKQRSEHFIESVNTKTNDYKFALLKDESEIGGGTMPGVTLPTYVVTVEHHSKSSQQLSQQLRRSTPSIVTRINKGKVVLDFRTVTVEEANVIVDILHRIS
ncbi:L-seryl-tRNA(Sec) selenium transferase [Cytobacillus sp. IB215316]|uniref:L-seryl-tRNA(Sec) selenium transferase n=1 Tax=Cytobacillus sp. IB215316 TaxID=3097354 RepID=UPI002A11435A|nr:L-seryl-tRNA(Sec) selenium transferase [Cytobacillus sp. IB215316]MDX8360160.1 L-seryl-tRNA(Sec) selenium transferase [Cytobacillus sp. IB215316]